MRIGLEAGGVVMPGAVGLGSALRIRREPLLPFLLGSLFRVGRRLLPPEEFVQHGSNSTAALPITAVALNHRACPSAILQAAATALEVSHRATPAPTPGRRPKVSRSSAEARQSRPVR